MFLKRLKSAILSVLGVPSAIHRDPVRSIPKDSYNNRPVMPPTITNRPVPLPLERAPHDATLLSALMPGTAHRKAFHFSPKANQRKRRRNRRRAHAAGMKNAFRA